MRGLVRPSAAVSASSSSIVRSTQILSRPAATPHCCHTPVTHSHAATSSIHTHATLHHATPSIPAAVSPSTHELDHSCILRTYARQPLEAVRGEGVWLWDAQGNKYMDFHSGIAVNILGHSHPRWVSAIQSQASKLTHVSNLFYTAPQARVAQKLLQLANGKFDKVFFCNSGTEANEAALKFVRKYQLLKAQERSAAASASANGSGQKIDLTRDDNSTRPHEKMKLVSFRGGFHGRSMGSLSLTSKWNFRAPFTPLLGEVEMLPWNDTEAACRSIDRDTAGVWLEPIQGEGGVHPGRVEFLSSVSAKCKEHDTLLVVDEVQVGLGRTGSVFAHQNEFFAGESGGSGGTIEPDLMTLAKPLAGGLPIGAVLLKQKVADALLPGDHGSTFSGGPLVCTGAEVVLDELSQPSLINNVAQRSKQLIDGLQRIRRKLDSSNSSIRVQDIRGLGLLIGLELNVPIASVVAAASRNGLLLITAGEKVIRLCPPLTINEEEMNFALNHIERAIQQVEADMKQ